MEELKIKFLKIKFIFKNLNVIMENLILQRFLKILFKKDLYIYLKKIMACLLMLDEKDIIFLGEGCGTVNVLSKSKFYKVGIRKALIVDEYDNWCRIRDKGKQFSSHFINVHYKQKYGIHILFSESLGNQNICRENVDINYMLEILRSEGKKEVRCIEQQKNILKGLELIKIRYGFEIFSLYIKRVEKIMERSYFYGPCHGDFHIDNVFKDEKGKLWFIDLDCYKENGMQALDAIYYFLEMGARREKLFWGKYIINVIEKKETLNSYLEEYVDINLMDGMFLSFLDRIGQENKYTCSVYMQKKHPIDDVNEFFLEGKL